VIWSFVYGANARCQVKSSALPEGGDLRIRAFPSPRIGRSRTRTCSSVRMAGGLVKYRHLSRSSAHRKALLRNLVESLIEHESISTTWHKAKEAQRLAEKMITLGKRNTEASKREAMKVFFVWQSHSVRLQEGLADATSRDPTNCSPNSSVPCENATSTDPADTHEYCG